MELVSRLERAEGAASSAERRAMAAEGDLAAAAEHIILLGTAHPLSSVCMKHTNSTAQRTSCVYFGMTDSGQVAISRPPHFQRTRYGLTLTGVSRLSPPIVCCNGNARQVRRLLARLVEAERRGAVAVQRGGRLEEVI